MAEYYFIFVALFLFVGGIVFFVSRIKLLANSTQFIGIIEDKKKLAWRQADGYGHAYHLVIRYTDNTGKLNTFTEQNSILTNFYQIGDKVMVIVDTNNPERVFVKSYIGLFSAPMLIILFSIVAAYIGISNA